MSLNPENIIDASEGLNTEKTSKTVTEVFAALIDEKIRANLEPLNAQILTLTQLLNHLIQDNSARTIPTADFCTHRPQTEPPFSREARISITLPGTAVGRTELRPIMRFSSFTLTTGKNL